MPTRHSIRSVAVSLLLCGVATSAFAFDWKAHEGETVSFLANNNPWSQAVLSYKDEFTALTGIKLKVDSYQEQQMRQRLVTVLNSGSDEVDVFMTLASREGQQFAASGWYADLSAYAQDAVAPEYDFAGISPALVKAATFDGKLTSVPLNLEGPLLYYRTDIFEACGLAKPASLDDVRAAAEKIKECDSGVTPFASRGLKPAIAYTFSNVLHNMGGTYIVDGKSALCSPAGQKAISYYGDLMREYGPPGAANYSFYQISALYRSGRAAMAFESSNELRTIMEGGERLNDTEVLALPAGEAGTVPTAIGWGLAISSHSAKKDAAWYFVQWASSPEMQKRLALQGVASPRASVASEEEYKAWIAEAPVRGSWQAALGVLASDGSSEVGYPIVANPESRDYIGQAVQDVLLGQRSVEEACAAADSALDGLIARK
ncbi:sugar ABC transporter substrate-binding protein [Rhizobium sp. TRM96647]|uniref:ABC transporter substrate-binding protein n=1 Tax=unclassified Rhizobium TaxID=2613769 RepID=UPI0021E967B1|nr:MULTISPECIES: sugar ABC transporter substrate-binding protein [unclassified Rhizobium]MCV3739242.1 sugar ABC transporter substrate-binding protein [Rhizobium sp. TRM96647]MCV3760880.1 sugar ABC transporter substrate-binding protein [Rhizobium sp. TRM96650]